MDELMVDKLGQLCGLVNHESVDWAVAVVMVVMMVLSALLFRSKVSTGIAQHFRSHRAGGCGRNTRSAKVQHPVGAAQAQR